jgi:hypothetical protein
MGANMDRSCLAFGFFRTDHNSCEQNMEEYRQLSRDKYIIGKDGD